MRFSEYFKLNKSQAELDFVDVVINKDTPLFIDPYAVGQSNDLWSTESHNLIVDFFQKAIDAIRENKVDFAKSILNNLHEPNETRLGMSINKPRGRAIGSEQSIDLYDHLKDSKAAQTGFLKDLEDCALVISNIDKDKISDITTNIIKKQLADYTKEQCQLLGIPTQSVPMGPFWDQHSSSWKSVYTDLPVCDDEQIILVPKSIVRYTLEYDYKKYYRQFVLNFLREEHINAGSRLVKTLKNGNKKVYKKDLEKEYPLTKDFLYDFSNKNPEVLKSYKDTKKIEITSLSDQEIEYKNSEKVSINYDDIERKLKAIPLGTENAHNYHNLIVGILESIFYPRWIFPKKEQEIHDGRKRIDIVFSNRAKSGFFFNLSQNIPALFIIVECKNYSKDPANPELDQIAGRFSPSRGKFGMIICRRIEDKDKFFARCKDNVNDDRGHIIGLDDDDILNLLKLKSLEDEKGIDSFIDNLYRKIVM